jgi:hypothetical protein
MLAFTDSKQLTSREFEMIPYFPEMLYKPIKNISSAGCLTSLRLGLIFSTNILPLTGQYANPRAILIFWKTGLIKRLQALSKTGKFKIPHQTTL